MSRPDEDIFKVLDYDTVVKELRASKRWNIVLCGVCLVYGILGMIYLGSFGQ